MTKSIKIGGKAAKEKEALTPEEEQRLRDTLKASKNEMDKKAYLLCLLALKTGLRRGELCGLMWSDIDFGAGTLTVNHNCIWPRNVETVVTETPKTEAGRRTIPLVPILLNALQSERQRTNSLFVFHRKDGQPLSHSSFRSVWSHAAATNAAETLTAHILRHTFCTRLFEKGFDVKEIQYLMGHSDIEMTLKIYTHYSKKSRFDDTASRLRAAL